MAKYMIQKYTGTTMRPDKALKEIEKLQAKLQELNKADELDVDAIAANTKLLNAIKSKFIPVREFEGQMVRDEIPVLLMTEIQKMYMETAEQNTLLLFKQVGDEAGNGWIVVGLQYPHPGKTDNPEWDPWKDK